MAPFGTAVLLLRPANIRHGQSCLGLMTYLRKKRGGRDWRRKSHKGTSFRPELPEHGTPVTHPWGCSVSSGPIPARPTSSPSYVGDPGRARCNVASISPMNQHTGPQLHPLGHPAVLSTFRLAVSLWGGVDQSHLQRCLLHRARVYLGDLIRYRPYRRAYWIAVLRCLRSTGR